jgi:hypothetical protein
MVASPYFIGDGTAAGSSATTTITLGATVTAAGDTLVVCPSISSSATAISSVTDSAGNIYTQQAVNTAENPTYVWVSPGLTGGSSGGPTGALTTGNTIVVHWTTPSGTEIAAAVGCTGLLKLDQNPATTNAASGTAASITSGTLSGFDEACVAVVVNGNTGGAGGTWAGGWTVLLAPTIGGAGAQYMSVASQVVTSTSAVTASFTLGSSSKWCMALLTFQYVVSISPSSLPAGVTSSPYSQTLSAANGTGAGYTWAKISGSLPPGLSLSGSGVISGTPSATGSYSFTVQVTDSGSDTATQPYTITVTAAAALVNSWTASAARLTTFTTPPPPYAQPLAVPISNQGNGNWLLVIASWRQDAGQAGVLAEPSTLSICDDAHNMWLPVAVTASGSGIVRQCVWMAPAARKAQMVFASPNGYQQALTLLVLEVSASVPWYQVAVTAQAYANQGTSVSASFTPPSGVFSVGVITWDSSAVTVTPVATGWTAAPQVTSSDGTDHSGDLIQDTWYVTAAGSALSLSASGTGGNADYSALLISVHGVTDPVGLPWSWPNPGWPVVLTELALGYLSTATPDQIIWTDLSARNTTLGPMTVTRQIQYEDQTLTAGTASVALDNPDSVLTPPDTPPSSAWSYAVSGTPAASSYFTVSTAQAAAITAGQTFTAAVAGSAQTLGVFTVTTVGTPAGGFVNVTFTPQAPVILSAASSVTVTQVWADDDIPLRIRTIWPWSPTPYSVLFSGFTDQLEPQWDPELLRGWVQTEASDAWSRLTAQMLTAVQQENLADKPYAYWPLGDSGPVPTQPAVPATGVQAQNVNSYPVQAVITANGATITNVSVNGVTAGTAAGTYTVPVLGYISIAYTGGPPTWVWSNASVMSASQIAPGSVAPLAVVESKNGAGPSTAGFGADSITLAGDPGGTGWQLSGLVAGDPNNGYTLTHRPANPASLPPAANGVTVEFWCDIGASIPSINWNPALAGCTGVRGNLWLLRLGGSTGYPTFSYWDKLTGAETDTILESVPFWNTTNLYTVVFTQTTWQVRINGVVAGSGTCNLAPVYSALTWCGWTSPWAGLAGACINAEFYGIVVYPYQLPLARTQAHYSVATTAAGGTDTDTARVARITGYGGFYPVLACRGLDNPPVNDIVTPVTDTSGQVTSGYITNIATSTGAGLLVDGPGALVYRRREEWFNRPVGMWTLGELFSAVLNPNPGFDTDDGISGWAAANGASLSWQVSPALPHLYQYAGLWAGNGSTANPQIQTASIPITPGVSYQVSAGVYSPQGYSAGFTVIIVWQNSTFGTLSVTQSAAVPVPAGGAGAVGTVSGQAPAGAVNMLLLVQAVGTPASTVQFVTGWGGATTYPGEVPYDGDVKLSLDRAQMYNTAVITQYGDQAVKAANTGTTITYADTSGITVTEQNVGSAAARGNVPYTVTSYLNNTAAAQTAYTPGQGSLEDYGQWTVNTLGTPSLRGEQVTILPAATGGRAWLMALQSDIGDTITLNKRPGYGQQETSVLTYLSGISHSIDFATMTWETQLTPSPAPQAQVLQLDNVLSGVLDGTNPIPW